MIDTNLVADDFFESKWLFDAALAVASNLPLVDVLKTGVLEQQLVLVRYSSTLDSNGFVYQQLIHHNAMWTNMVTCISATTADITGLNLRGVRVGLNVVRLGFPANYQLMDKWSDEPIWQGRAKRGLEFWLRFDIPKSKFSSVPFDYEPEKQIYTKPTTYTVPPFDSSGWLPRLC